MIDLICPSRRPDKLRKMWNSARATAVNSDALRLHVGVDASQEYEIPEGNVKEYRVLDWGVVHTSNCMVRHALEGDGRLFMMIGDDTVFTTPEWDRALIEAYKALKNKAHVFCLRDSRSQAGTPHPIATREFINVLGYFSCPIFLHWHVDTWMADIAKANKIFTHLKDYELVHDKSIDTGIPDETHTRIRERGWLDRDNFVAESCGHFLALEKLRVADALDNQMTIAQRFGS